jgi:pilus assembly protein CpaE
MPNAPSIAGLQHPQAASAPPAPAPAKREKFIGFVRDEDSAALLFEAFSACLPDGNHFHVAGFRGALAILASKTTPEIVLIDLSGEDQPINAMMELADAVEPGTTVLAIGEPQNVNFYRTITKGMGIKEYLTKPLTRAAVEKNFLPIISNMALEAVSPRGGRLVSMAGARGGVGASTIATNLAWFISSCLHRHTVLLDAELYTGTIALHLNLEASNGLGIALETPERVDPLLIERSMRPAGERLHVLAGQENMNRAINYKHDSANLLIRQLRARYNFVIADTGSRLEPFSRDLTAISQQRVVVLDPSMISIRNFEKRLALPTGPSQSPRIVTVLNRAGTPGGLAQSYMEQVMGLRFDAVIPDLPRIVPKTTQFGEQAASLRGPFRTGISQLAIALGASLLPEAG